MPYKINHFSSFWCDPAALQYISNTNTVYFLADESSKQSSHFHRLCSILSANGSTLFPLFSVSTSLSSILLNYHSLLPTILIKTTFCDSNKKDRPWNALIIHQSDGNKLLQTEKQFYLKVQSMFVLCPFSEIWLFMHILLSCFSNFQKCILLWTICWDMNCAEVLCKHLQVCSVKSYIK